MASRTSKVEFSKTIDFPLFFQYFWPLGRLLGVSWGGLGGSWSVLGASWGSLVASWVLLGGSWRELRVSGGDLGASWGVLGASWGPLGSFLGLPWESLDAICGILKLESRFSKNACFSFVFSILLASGEALGGLLGGLSARP